MTEAKIMEKTKQIALRHLEDIGDAVERNGWRISNHMALDGIKDSLKILHYLRELSEDSPEPVKAAV